MNESKNITKEDVQEATSGMIDLCRAANPDLTSLIIVAGFEDNEGGLHTCGMTSGNPLSIMLMKQSLDEGLEEKIRDALDCQITDVFKTLIEGLINSRTPAETEDDE